MEQLSLLMEAPAQPKVPVDVRVRARLCAMLDELRRADVMPWTATELERWRLLVPQMCRWLPGEEAEEVRLGFQCELERLRAPVAAL